MSTKQTNVQPEQNEQDTKELPPIDVWIQNIKFTTTEDIKVPENLLDQVIGQDQTVAIVKKAAEQKRHVMLIGVLTGPYTLTKSSVDSFYHDEKQLAFDFATALRKEAELLLKHVDLISIDEPVFSNELPEYANELIQTITKGLSRPTRLHVCGDVSRIIPQLVDMPVDILSHEFKASPYLFNVFQEYPCNRNMCIGSVRSDDTVVESVEDIVTHVNKAIAIFDKNVVQIAPDCGQRLLPRTIAFQKLKNLAAAGEILNGG